MCRALHSQTKLVTASMAALLLLMSGCAAQKGQIKASSAKEELALRLFKEGAELLFNDNQAALTKFDQAREIDVTMVPAHFNAGVALEALGSLPEAAKRYEACLAQKKDQPNCLVNLLLVKAKLGEVDQANQIAQTYLNEYPESPFAQSAAAHLALYRKDYGLAEKLARQAIERDAENIEALFVMARLFFERKQWAAAKLVAKNALEIAPSHGGLYLLLGHTERELDSLHDALDSYGLAVKFQPTEEALESYGLLLLKRGRVAEALPVLQRLLALRPDNFKNHLHVGNAYMANKKFVDAKAAYLRALELKPDDKDINFNLGILFYDQKPEGLAEIDRLKTAEGYFKTYLDQTGLAKERIKEANEYLDIIKQKIELEEYKASAAEEPEPEPEPDMLPSEHDGEPAHVKELKEDDLLEEAEPVVEDEKKSTEEKKPKSEKPKKGLNEEEEDFFGD
jgi:tetratricopeptide (TPR) repeat protein